MASGKMIETILKTTQGRFAGLNGGGIDHSINGCAVIASMVASAGLVNIASLSFIESIIDDLCQEPLRLIRARSGRDQGYALVHSEDAIAALVDLELLSRPTVN